MAYAPLGNPLTDLLKAPRLKPTLSFSNSRPLFSKVTAAVSKNIDVKKLAQTAAKRAAQVAVNAKKANVAAMQVVQQKQKQDAKVMEARAKADRKAREDAAKAAKKSADAAAKSAKDRAKAEAKAAKNSADELKRTDFDLDPVGPAGGPMTLSPDTTAADAAAETLRQRPVYTTPQGGEVYDASQGGPINMTPQDLPEVTATGEKPNAASFGVIGALVLVGILLSQKGKK